MFDSKFDKIESRLEQQMDRHVEVNFTGGGKITLQERLANELKNRTRR
jgi:hypothetical protein